MDRSQKGGEEMDDEMIELQVASFSLELEIAERRAAGLPADGLTAEWCHLALVEYSSEQLLESVHRHVKSLTEAENEGALGVFDHHLTMLNLVADEIERRLEHGRQPQ